MAVEGSMRNVVEHDNGAMNLKLSDAQQSDLVEYFIKTRKLVAGFARSDENEVTYQARGPRL